MELDYLVLADAATAAEGKLYIHGAGWDRVLAREWPAAPAMAAAVRLRIPWTDTNQPHALELDIVNEDGLSILPIPPGPFQGTINMGRPPIVQPGDDQFLPLAFHLNGVKFERAGVYVVLLRIDGRDVGR